MVLDSIPDWIIIIVIVLVLFGGAKKIPEFARSLGKATGEYTRGKMELEREIRNSLNTGKEIATPSTNYKDAAKSLGIDITNKTDEQLKQEIASKVSIQK